MRAVGRFRKVRPHDDNLLRFPFVILLYKE